MRGTPDTRHARGGTPRWRRLLARVAVIATSGLMASVLLVLFFAWLALQVDWEVPSEPAALAAPSVLLDRDGNEIARFTSQVDRRVVGLDEVSEDARNAVVAAEDARFYEHEGVDPVSLLRAVASNLRTGGIAQGGSTLTQQYVKNAYLSSERTIARKVQEAVISIALEREKSKEEILEAYLNQVYFGELAYGIEAAALTYFGIPAAELDAAQGALLAQLLPAPSQRNPRVDPTGARQRRDRVLDTMVQLDMLTPAEAEQAKAQPVEVLPRRRPEVAYPYFVEYVRRQLVAAYGEEAVLTGSLRVTTTLDPEAMAALRTAVEQQLPRQEGEFAAVDAGAAAVDPATGEILGVYGGRSFEESQVNLATQLSVRQPGSTFKPFVFLTALRQGLTPDETYPAPARVVPDTCPPGPDGDNPFKEPVANASGAGYGRLSIADALANSVNTVLVQLGCDVGPDRIVETMSLMGVRNNIAPEANVSIGGGSTGPSPLDLASAYATLANDGLACPAHAIKRVVDPSGRFLPLPEEVALPAGNPGRSRVLSDEELGARPDELAARDEGRCRQVLDPDHARTTTAVLERVVAETTGRRADIGRPQAGKTGTTNGPTDAWFAGYTPDLAMAVWVGDRASSETVLRGIEGFRSVQGGTIPALIWRDAATSILADVPPSDFLDPGEDDDGGRRPAPARPKPPVETADPPPTDAPSEDGSPTDAPTPGEEPTTPPPDDGGDDPPDDGCFLVFC